MLYTAVGLCLVIAYLVAPLSQRAIAGLDIVFPLACVVAIVVGVRWHKPERLRPWVLFAVGMFFFLIENSMTSLSIMFTTGPIEHSPVQDLLETIGYVLVITALISLIYSRDGGARDRSSLIDASIIVGGAAMLAWVFIFAPFAHDASIPVTARLFKMLYPLANLILLAVSVRLAVSRGARTPAFALLLFAMVASLIANTLSLSEIEAGGVSLPSSPVDVAAFFAYIFAGAAPLHASMRSLTDVGMLESRITRTRLALFLGASTTGVAAYFIEHARGREVDVPVILIGSLSIFLLVLIRLAGLNRQMQRSEERFRSLVQNASDAFAILEPDGTVRYVSPASERIVGFSPEEMAGAPYLTFVHDDYLESAQDYVKQAFTMRGPLDDILLKAKHKDGSWRWLEVSCTNLLDDPAVMGIVANFHDVTETRKAEEALRASEQNSRLLFESSPLPMWVFDDETLAFLAVNDAAVAHYGYSRAEFLEMTISDIRPPGEVKRLEQEIKRIRAAAEEDVAILRCGEWQHQLKDGHVITVETVSQPLDFSGRSAWLVVAQDITDRKRMEAEKESLEGQLMQSQKLEAVGQLAGGIAHDFNNLLAVILNYGRFVQEDLPPETAAHEDMSQIISAADKAAALVRQLLAFSRREIVKPEIIDLNEVVEEMHKLLRRTTKESIDLVVELGDGLWRTNADPGRIEQVLMNLAVNADAAMPDGGTLKIATSNEFLSEDVAAQRAELKAGNYVCISVSDDGIGMSEETAARIFEPFFTTKGTGEGTGLGLSTAYGIVKQAGGYIYATSDEGRGTIFEIYLPATDAPIREGETPLFVHDPRPGTGTILVVEDEAAVRAIIRRILEDAGYDVVVANDPFHALELAAEGTPFDLLLTDVIMPGLSGRDLAQRVQAIRPDLKTIFMSGYTDEIIASQGVLEDGLAFLQKPFGPKDLLPLVRDVLQDKDHPQMERPLTVLVVDDEEPMRHVLDLLLASHGFVVVGAAADAEEAIKMAGKHQPDVIVLDHSMPGAMGDEVAALLREVSPHSKICAFSGILDRPPGWADAFLSKSKIGELPPTVEELGV